MSKTSRMPRTSSSATTFRRPILAVKSGSGTDPYGNPTTPNLPRPAIAEERGADAPTDPYGGPWVPNAAQSALADGPVDPAGNPWTPNYARPAHSLSPHFAPYAAVDARSPPSPLVPRNGRVRSRVIKCFGWIRDIPDARDHWYAAPLATALPPHFDLRNHIAFPPVYNQGELGSCSANALAAAVQVDRLRQNLSRANEIPSRLFIYYNEREIEGTVSVDAGGQLRDGIKTLASLGCCFEGTRKGDWNYKQPFKRRPPDACYRTALRDRTVSYSRLQQKIDQMRGCLGSGYPFVFGFTVYESFETRKEPRIQPLGTVPQPAAGERAIGAHAAMAVGYDDGTQRFTVRNSWGPNWGDHGHFTIPYTYVGNTELAGDFWTIRLVLA